MLLLCWTQSGCVWRRAEGVMPKARVCSLTLGEWGWIAERRDWGFSRDDLAHIVIYYESYENLDNLTLYSSPGYSHCPYCRALSGVVRRGAAEVGSGFSSRK